MLLPRLSCFFYRSASRFVSSEAFGRYPFTFRSLFALVGGFLTFFCLILRHHFFCAICGRRLACVCACFAVSFCLPVSFLAFALL